MTPHQYDMIVFGAGIAGLWLANAMKRAGYNVIVIENDRIGGGQTMASHGIIHDGREYSLQGSVTRHAASIAAMPARWDSCLDGYGEVDLTTVKVLSDHQVMWPAAQPLSDVLLQTVAQAANADARKLSLDDIPEPLCGKKSFKGSVYRLPEKVLDTRSLMLALSLPLKGRILKGTATDILPDGQVAVDGVALQAQLVVFAAGTGNERVFEMLKLKKIHTRRRPLRQVMVRSLPYPIYGHGITGAAGPRVTITSHPLSSHEYVWYLGGNIAEEGAKMTDEDALSFARSEMQDMFPAIDWATREWATWAGDRAEPFSENGELPPGPFVHQRGKILVAWPSKLTFAPALADHVFKWLEDKEIAPLVKTDPPPLPTADIGSYPWETAVWTRP
jgi:glycine/D-amino acid oxidase-like deaminating enzyme